MQDYDTVLKLLLRGSAGCLLQQLINESSLRWLNVELPRAQQPRVDLLGETQSGSLEHIELQSQNDAQMPLRMLEYRVGIYRHYGQLPRQTVLYVGREKLSMPSALEAEHLSFRYRLVDASVLDGEAMLVSEGLGDNVLAILTHVKNQNDAIKNIVARIGLLNARAFQDSVNQLLIISGLRGLSQRVKEEVNKMPVTENILDHELIGPAYRSGLQQGRVEGRLEGERAVLLKLLEKRFGPLPASVTARLDQSSTEALEDIGIRLLDAGSLEELLS